MIHLYSLLNNYKSKKTTDRWTGLKKIWTYIRTNVNTLGNRHFKNIDYKES